MSDSNQPSATGSQQWWLSQQGTPTGPHTEDHILAGLKAGTILAAMYACPVGSQEWRHLSEWPTFAPVCSVEAAPAPPPPPPDTHAAVTPVPWNPRTIAWLGLLFSPVWAGIMAAINARRLQMRFPYWQPIAIGIGATALDYLFTMLIFDSYVVDAVLYLGAVGIIWFLYLDTQVRHFENRRAQSGKQAGWIVPALVGSPAAILVIYGFIVLPLLPLGPRQVCQKFIDASTMDEMRKYTTTKLWPALAAMDAHKNDPDSKVGAKDRFDLTEDVDNPLGLGGHGVGYRMYSEEKGGAHVLEGFFYLVNQGAGWKIDELYFTSFDNQQAQNPIPVSSNYKEIFGAGDSSQNLAAASGTPSPVGPATGKQDNKANNKPSGTSNREMLERALRSIYDQFGWFGAVVAIIVVVVIRSVLINVSKSSLTTSTRPKANPPSNSSSKPE